MMRTGLIKWISMAALASVTTFGAAPVEAQRRPVIESIRPAAGAPGTQITILGRNLGRSSQVFLGNSELRVLQRLPNRWTVVVPEGAASGRLVIRTASGNYAGPSFRVTAAAARPTISAVEPGSGGVGSEVVIVGENFSARAADNIVFLNELPAVVRTATPTELRVIVPSRASSGTFSVRVGNTPEVRSPQFTVSAGTFIAELDPPAASPGSEVIIRGGGFGSGVRGNQVYLGRTRLRVRSATANEIVVRIPRRRASSGRILVDVRNGGRVESTNALIIQDAANIRAVEPAAGSQGTTVTVSGSGFGRDRRAVRVTVGGMQLSIQSVQDDQIVAVVPRGLQTGALRVEVNGVGSDHGQFEVLLPLSIQSFSPRQGDVGTVVTLRGQGFSPRAADNHVTLGGVEQTVLSASRNELQVRIMTAPSGPFQVRTPGAAGSTSGTFIMQVPPFIASFAPMVGPVGETVTIHGAHFGTSARGVRVTLGRAAMQVVSVQDDRISVRVPRGARSGRITVSVGTQGGAVTGTEFEVEARRAVSSLSPASAFAGTEVTIRGENFPRTAQVQFTGAAPVAARRVSRVELRAIVPQDAQTGAVTVLLSNSRVMSAGNLTVTAAPSGLAVTSIEPECPYAGCTAVLRGHGFSARVRQNRVRFNGAAVRVVSATAGALTITLPAAGNGRFEVNVRRVGRAQSPPFLVQSRR